MNKSDSFYDNVAFVPSSRQLSFDGPIRPYAEPGTYVARFVGHRTCVFITPRVELIFDLFDPEGDSIGMFGMFCTVKDLVGPARTNGEFIPKGPKSKLAGLFRALRRFDPESKDMSLKALTEHLWKVELGSPENDTNGEAIPESDRYSVVLTAVPVERMDDF